MKVKAKKSFFGALVEMSVGDILDVTEQVGKDLLRADLVETVEEPKPAKKTPEKPKKAKDKKEGE